MRCRKCGNIIANGTLCENCYKKNNLNKDDAVIMKIGRKFLPKYQLKLKLEWFIFAIFGCIIALLANSIITCVAFLMFIFIVIGISLFINKKIAVGTKCLFYETKVVYVFDFLFIHTKKVIQYSDIKDIIYNQSSGYRKRLQKKYHLGNIVIINKKSKILFNGIILNDVANIEEVFKKLTETVGDKIF